MIEALIAYCEDQIKRGNGDKTIKELYLEILNMQSIKEKI